MKEYVKTTAVLIALAVYALGCGQYEEGSTDHFIDCVDGCTTEQDEREVIALPGPRGPVGAPGTPGETGATGPEGARGEDGVLTDEQLETIAELEAKNEEQDMRLEAIEAILAEDDDISISAILDPCGDKVGAVDEVLFALSDGSVVAWYKGVGQVVLAEDVVYRTTDSQKCYFKIVNGEMVEL